MQLFLTRVKTTKQTSKSKQNQIKELVFISNLDLYTFWLKTDNSFVIFVNQEEEMKGNLLEFYDFLPKKTIPNPKDTKPDNWIG